MTAPQRSWCRAVCAIAVVSACLAPLSPADAQKRARGRPKLPDMLLAPPAAGSPFPLPTVRVEEMHVVTAQPRLYAPGPIYAMIGTATPAGPQASGQWHRFDLKPWGVPADATAVFLVGILIITHGTTIEIANMDLAFRSPLDHGASCAAKIAQTVEAQVGGGQRANVALWAPVEDGVVEMCMTRSTGGVWPQNAAYGVNLTFQAWVR